MFFVYGHFLHVSYDDFTACEAWTLARMLPLLIGDLVPESDDNWQNYLLLLSITDYVMAPHSTKGIVVHLKSMIAEHHTTFTELYPERHLTPKMHYMVHLPVWMLRCIS